MGRIQEPDPFHRGRDCSNGFVLFRDGRHPELLDLSLPDGLGRTFHSAPERSEHDALAGKGRRRFPRTRLRRPKHGRKRNDAFRDAGIRAAGGPDGNRNPDGRIGPIPDGRGLLRHPRPCPA